MKEKEMEKFLNEGKRSEEKSKIDEKEWKPREDTKL